MEKIINKLINDFTEGVDTYTHNGSTWLIFTESKQWVIELTENKTLWYNYNFFAEIFSYTSMDVVDNQSYITKWVEDNVINKVERTSHSIPIKSFSVDDIIQDGVKHTYIGGGVALLNTIKDGVIKTKGFKMRTDWSIEDTIENGIKETRPEINITEGEVDDIIQDGVKYTFPNSETGTSNDVERVIKNGVKDTYCLGSLEVTEKEINNTLQNGVRDTQSNPYENESWIEGVIKNGVKETKQKKNAYLVLDTSGRELILESHLVIRDGVKETNYDTDNYTDDVKEVIREGVKETSHRQFLKTYDVKDTIQDGTEHDRWILDGCADPVDVVLENGVRNSHPLQYRTKDMIDMVINKGIKETHDDVYHHKGRIDGVIKNGVKETKEMLDWVCTDRMLSNILENGIKEVVSYDEHKRGPVNTFGYIDDIIKEGEKINGTYAGGQRQSEKCKSVVEYGTKNPTD